MHACGSHKQQSSAPSLVKLQYSKVVIKTIFINWVQWSGAPFRLKNSYFAKEMSEFGGFRNQNFHT